MYRSLNFPFASFLLFQAAVSEWPVCDAATLTTSSSCDTSSLLVRPSGTPTLSSARCFNDAARQSSVITATSTPQTSHHHVGIIVGVHIGAFGAILLVGLFLFWLYRRHRRHRRHRHPTETAEIQDVEPRSWALRDFLRCHSVVVIANHRTRSIDLAGAGTDATVTSVPPPTSDETSETKQWNKSTEVLDISVENAPQSPPPPLPLPEPEPIETSNPVAPLCIHTDVQADLSPSSSHSSTPAGPSRSSIRPLPTPPTGPQVRRHRSATAKAEAHRESGHNRRPPRRKISADDVRALAMYCEADGCETLQHHHNGGMNAWTDFPPPYSES
ncbi:hypothetical protein F5888DRAFT_1891262 [Russula emetica]|nr:hypothetical protein F5888DRAFT_1891262 [Russula emetica]